jgi:hypothetical protein
MSKALLFASLSVFMSIGLILTGCSNQQPSASPPETPQSQPAATGHEHQGSGPAGHQPGESGHAGHSEYADALAQLSAEDRALAEKQETCPVSGEPLGSMGKPHKVTVSGRGVFLCCQGCEGEIKGDPEKYLAKLPE